MKTLLNSLRIETLVRKRREREKMFAAENGLKGDPRLEAISAAIRVVPNFPKKGL